MLSRFAPAITAGKLTNSRQIWRAERVPYLISRRMRETIETRVDGRSKFESTYFTDHQCFDRTQSRQVFAVDVALSDGRSCTVDGHFPFREGDSVLLVELIRGEIADLYHVADRRWIQRDTVDFEGGALTAAIVSGLIVLIGQALSIAPERLFSIGALPLIVAGLVFLGRWLSPRLTSLRVAILRLIANRQVRRLVRV